MTTITTRSGKGSALSFAEVDGNFTNLNTDKLEGVTSSVDGELTLWSSTTGKVLKRATITGLVKATSGVASAATSGTDYLAPPSGTAILKANSGGALANATAGTDYVAPGTATTFTANQTFNSGTFKLAGSTSGTATVQPQAAAGTVTMTLPTDTSTLGYLNAPINSQSAAYTLVLSDAGKVILHPSTDANARTFTIPANGSVAYPDGTVITFVNMTSQVVTIAITTDTLYLAGTGTTGSRSLAQYGMASAVKLTSTTWLISGSGLT